MTENGQAGKADTWVSQAPVQLFKDLICLEDGVPAQRDLSCGNILSELRTQAGRVERNVWRPCDNKYGGGLLSLLWAWDTLLPWKTSAASSLSLGKTMQFQQNRLRDVVRLFGGDYFHSMRLWLKSQSCQAWSVCRQVCQLQDSSPVGRLTLPISDLFTPGLVKASDIHQSRR